MESGNFNLPKKVFKDEEDNDEEINYGNTNNRNNSKKHYKYNTGKKLNREEEKRRKQLEKDLEDEINKNELSDENDKNKNNNNINSNINKDISKNEKKEVVINEISANKMDRSYDATNTYKKPVQKNFGNGKNKIYCPKRPSGAIRGRSQEKSDQNAVNKVNKGSGLKNITPHYTLTSMNSKKINGNAFNSPNMAYSKKRSIGGIGGDNNFLQLNKSFGEYRSRGIENGNNFMNGMYNINTLELSSLPDLNSSFDSRLLSYNNNNLQYNLNSNDLYNRTAQKNYHNNTINSNNLTNNSNRFTNMNNFFGMNNMGNLNNINGLSYINGDSDNFINMSNLNLNNNSSFFELRQQPMNPFDLNNSYNLGYNNPLSNYPNNQASLSGLFSNNYLGLNNNIPRGMPYFNAGNNGFQNMIAKKSSSINIEDLLVLEEKLNEISNSLNKTKIMYNECFEFWNYYFNCSFYGSLEKLFTNVMDSNNVQISINYILMSVLICYDCSFDIDVLNNVYSVLKDLLNFSHKNLMLIYEHILSKISNESRDNIWVLKLLNIVNNSKNSDFSDYNLNNGYSMTLVEKINFNTGIIIQNIRVLLKNYKTPRVEYLTTLFKKINEKSYEEINIFYRQYILRVDNLNGSILGSVFLKNNTEFKSEPAPYLHTTNNKPYSLILDLDETLVHFKVSSENENEGVLKVRPGVMEFLESVDKYYELIIFTCATQDYANLLIDAIEENKIYFEHRLYRQHTVIIDNDFVKDLTRIGRPLDKIAIVDNMPQNFRLQKENGINIKAFWGEDIYDTALINLSPILINIAEEGGDIRKGLAKYRDEIVEKVTSNISKNNI
jgi:Dullard-like phosphatase family protein